MDANKFAPLYLRITDEIINRIKTGDLTTGAQVPSENEIRAMYKVSNTTARNALAELVKEGWINRKRGKGSFVSQPIINRDITRITSFSQNMERMGLNVSTRVLFKNRHLKRGNKLVIGGVEYVLDAPYLHIARLRFGDKVPITLENRYINLEICPDLENRDLSQSFYTLYEAVYGRVLLKARQTISAISIDAGTARKLDCRIGQPGFLVESVLFTAGERILDLESSVYRGDRYRFLIETTK
jgi:GntR family transcriptional regulator